MVKNSIVLAAILVASFSNVFAPELPKFLQSCPLPNNQAVRLGATAWVVSSLYNLRQGESFLDYRYTSDDSSKLSLRLGSASVSAACPQKQGGIDVTLVDKALGATVSASASVKEIAYVGVSVSPSKVAASVRVSELVDVKLAATGKEILTVAALGAALKYGAPVLSKALGRS